MWALDHKEDWTPKNWYFQIVVLEKTLSESLWLPDVKSWLIGKAPDAGKDWRQKEKGAAEDEMFG